MNSKSLTAGALSLISLLMVNSSEGYEVATHAWLTNQAYGESQISHPGRLYEFGIENKDQTFGIDTYIDVHGNTAIQRTMQDTFVDRKINDELNLDAERYTIPGWLMRGAIREDDYESHSFPCDIPSENPGIDPDPYPDPPDRPLNHFFDPTVTNPSIAGLSILGVLVPGSSSAPEWATGLYPLYSDSPSVMLDRRNHFTVQDAREYMYRALTGKAGEETLDIRPAGFNGTDLDLRNAYWASTFRSLGDIVHLVEDMAQPQHTRNDPHSGQCGETAQGFFGHASFYERYIEARVTHADEAVDKIHALDSSITKESLSSINMGSSTYKAVSFNSYRDYWSTRDGDDGRGLADYSNREFFSAGKNFRERGVISFEYASPSNYHEDYSVIQVLDDGRNGVTNYLVGPYVDKQESSSFDTLKTKEGILFDFVPQDPELLPQTTYELDPTIYDVQAALLLPRAIAYSAGLIDYFFRGRLAISLPDEGIYGLIDQATSHVVVNGVPLETENPKVFGFNKIFLNVANVTPDIHDGANDYVQNVGTGTLRAVAYYRYNPCYTLDLSGESTICNTGLIEAQPMTISTSKAMDVSSIGTSGSDRFEFDFSDEPIPVNAVDLRIQVVFRGQLGLEADGIAVGMKDVAEPTYISYRNSTDYFSLDGTNYPPMQIMNDPDLLAKIDVNPKDGVPDVPIDPKDVPAGTINVGNVTGAIQSSVLHPQDYIRFVVLGDYGTVNVTSNLPSWDNNSFDLPSRRAQWDEATKTYIFSWVVPLGSSGGELYNFHVVRLIRDPYPPNSTPGPSSDYVNVPDPGATPVTICFPSCTQQ